MEDDGLKNSSFFSNGRSIMTTIRYVNWGCKDCFAELPVLACDVYNKVSKYGDKSVGERGTLYTNMKILDGRIPKILLKKIKNK